MTDRQGTGTIERAGIILPDRLSVREVVSAYQIRFGGYSGEYPPEAHSSSELVTVLEGEHTLLLDGERYALRPGQLLFYPPHAIHMEDRPSRASVYILCFKTDWSGMNLLYKRILTLSVEQQKAIHGIMLDFLQLVGVAGGRGGRYVTVLKESASEERLQLVKNTFEAFLLSLYIRENGEEAYGESAREFGKVVQYMEMNLDRTLTLEELASANYMSVSRLKRIFSENCGTGPIHYFLARRLDRAKEMIQKQQGSLTDISQALGFCSVQYFSRVFRAYTGFAPSEYGRLQKRT